MKKATTGWPVKGLSSRLRPARGYGWKGYPAPMADWQKRRAQSNAQACITGYDAKLTKVRSGKGNHNAVCNPTR